MFFVRSRWCFWHGVDGFFQHVRWQDHSLLWGVHVHVFYTCVFVDKVFCGILCVGVKWEDAKAVPRSSGTYRSVIVVK